MTWNWKKPAVLALGILALALFPLFAESYTIKLMSRVMALGILAMSLDLLVGYTGLVSLGHAAFFGLSGYVTAALINKAGLSHLAAVLPAALGASAAAALAVGWLSIRTSGIYFIMITLALAQMLYFFFHDLRFWGGGDGLSLDLRPVFEMAGATLLDLGRRVELYYFALGALVLTFASLAVMLRSPFGMAVQGVRANEGRMTALGYDVARLKLASFVIAGTLAGLAGFVEVCRTAFISPDHLSWHQSGYALVLVLLGGKGTLWGPVLGALVLVLAEDAVSSLTPRWPMVMGVLIIALVLALPRGLAGLAERRHG